MINKKRCGYYAHSFFKDIKQMGETFKYIIIWLFIFIVGSLIVNFLISPNSFQSFKSNIKSIIPESLKVSSPINSHLQIEEIDMKTSCSLIEAIGESEGIRNLKKKECTAQCGLKELEYSSFKCIKDKFYCYCLN